MTRKKPAGIVKPPEPEIELTLGPVKYKLPTATACCLAGVFAFIGMGVGFGALPFLFSGFASAASVASIAAISTTRQNELRDMIQIATDHLETRALNGQINNTQRAYCSAIKSTDGAAIMLAGDQLSTLLIDYQKLTSKDFPLQPCP